MERLNLSAPPEEEAIEAAIHLARYAGILPIVQDKIVLDVACGEGYGAALMMQAGARRVVGVDVSEEAIRQCRKLFEGSGAEFIQADAEELTEHFESGTFDVVVSIETVEHVDDIDDYFLSLKAVSKERCVYYITCPNDNWYYGDGSADNEFHKRRFTFEEFKEVSIAHLGSNVSWGLGSAVLGFGSFPLDCATSDALASTWISSHPLQSAISVTNTALEPVNPQNCSYFVGIWNSAPFSSGAACFGINMNAYARAFDEIKYCTSTVLKNKVAEVSREECCKAREEISKKEAELEVLADENRKKTLILYASHTENIALKENIASLRQKMETAEARMNAMQVHVDDMQIGYWRYRKVSDKVPRSIKTIGNYLRRLFRRR